MKCKESHCVANFATLVPETFALKKTSDEIVWFPNGCNKFSLKSYLRCVLVWHTYEVSHKIALLSVELRSFSNQNPCSLLLGLGIPSLSLMSLQEHSRRIGDPCLLAMARYSYLK